jgi:ABC-type polysaccharide/polyol phosphate transport system ATPase subunit
MSSNITAEPGQDLVIQVRGLTKSYGKVRALRGINLDVKQGEIFGFLGPNGAGKTTLMAAMPGCWGWIHRLSRLPSRLSRAICPAKCNSSKT